MKIRGTQSEVGEIEIGIDTVYVRSNIVTVDEEDFKGWEYDEVQYEKDHYIKLMAEKNKILEIQVTDTQLALCEIFEGMVA